MWISEKEKAQLGYSRPPQGPYSDHISSPKTSNRSSDIDFRDVFGGPPKRASLQDTKSRYSGESSRGGAESNDDTSPGRTSWGEKPVFGSETRRYTSGGFFDDIFRGDESLSSSPRMDSKDPNSSAAASRIVSPTRPLPAGVELLGFPAESSFSPTLESSNSLSNSKGRISSKAVQNQDVIQGGEAVSSDHWGPLSRSVSSKDEELRKNVMMDGSCSRARISNGSGLFHFSMHNWASKGVPLVMSLGRGNSMRLKDKNELERSLRLNGSAEHENDALVGKVVDESATDAFRLTPNDKVEDTQPAFSMGSVSNAEEVCKPDAVAHKSDLKKSSAELHRVENAAPEVRGKQKVAEVKLTPVLDIDDAESDEGLERSKLRESSVFKGTNMRNSVDGRGDMENDVYRGKVEETTGDDRASGKVKDFVKIFNHEPSSKLTTDVNRKSSRWGNSGLSRKISKPAPIPTKKEEKIESFDVNCRLDASPKVEENHISDGKESHRNNAHRPGEDLSRIDENLGSTPGLGSKDSEAWSTSVDDIHGNFLIEELPEVTDKSTEDNENHEDIKILESKILKWSKGKEGNIRALLSTLQYVLWPNSGWKPIPLVDIIEANAVKRSYQRALLRLHPDKLQQKGAAFHHKFIAEKVFDILQEAWDHFNTLGSL